MAESLDPGSDHPTEAGATPSPPQPDPPKPPGPSSAAPAAAGPASRWKRWAFLALALIGVVAGGIALIPVIRTSLNTISTDDAYINGHATFLAARVGGQVARVLVEAGRARLTRPAHRGMATTTSTTGTDS